MTATPKDEIDKNTYEILKLENIVRNGIMKGLSVLQEMPFTDRGS